MSADRRQSGVANLWGAHLVGCIGSFEEAVAWVDAKGLQKDIGRLSNWSHRALKKCQFNNESPKAIIYGRNANTFLRFRTVLTVCMDWVLNGTVGFLRQD